MSPEKFEPYFEAQEEPKEVLLKREADENLKSPEEEAERLKDLIDKSKSIELEIEWALSGHLNQNKYTAEELIIAKAKIDAEIMRIRLEKLPSTKH